MSTRIAHKWVAGICGLMLTMGGMTSASTFAQDGRTWGFAPLPWTPSYLLSPAPTCANGTCRVTPRNSNCPNGTCSPKTRTPVWSNGVSRPVYPVSPARPVYRNLPPANQESPFYEYRDAPSRSTTPPVRQPIALRTKPESPFYP
ncbi:MAG: hypothetical protein JSS49_17665 [Planctomycetes bacterium]|nr:hypothetical protein [Planctomycetota bacterium]